MRVLVVEDSKYLLHYLEKALKGVGYAVDLAADGREGLWLGESNNYDVIILDLMLPEIDGISLLEQLREMGSKTPVLILSAKDRIDDRVFGLAQGADDYLVKPFALEELLARVRSLVRRRYNVKSPLIGIDDLTLDTRKRTVRRGKQEIALRPREYAMLEYLLYRKGEVVSRTEIEEHIYDHCKDMASNVVDSTICVLRKKIDHPGSRSLIQTRRGMGYLIEETA